MKENPTSGGWDNAHHWEHKSETASTSFTPTQQPTSIPSHCHRAPSLDPSLDQITCSNLGNPDRSHLLPFHRHPAHLTLALWLQLLLNFIETSHVVPYHFITVDPHPTESSLPSSPPWTSWCIIILIRTFITLSPLSPPAYSSREASTLVQPNQATTPCPHTDGKTHVAHWPHLKSVAIILT